MALAQPKSDVATLWEEALDDYKKDTNTDIRDHLTSPHNIESIKAKLLQRSQERQLEAFTDFRHDKGRLDRFRTMINTNADIVQGLSNNISSAASLAFPPSSVILTAFTLVLTASKRVSDDYDLIEGFFQMMHSFLRRLSLLENKIPPERHFQIFLIKVFSSLLKLNAIAQSYRKEKRFAKWAKALVEVDGKDPNLKGAYDSLRNNLEELESAMIIQTLRNTIEISEEGKSTNQNVKAVRGQLERNTTLAIKNLEHLEQLELGVQQLLSNHHESAATNTDMLRFQKSISDKIDKLQTSTGKEKERNMKSGASRPANFARLKTRLRNEAVGGMTEKYKDMALAYIDRLFDWIHTDPAFESFFNDEERLLHVSGTSGMGKTTLSFHMFRLLEKKFHFEATTCTAWFSFDEEDPEMRSIINMLQYCAIEAAKKDDSYCTGLLKALAGYPDFDTNEDAYIRLVESMYTKDSGRRLILVLDGIDQLAEENFLDLIKLLSRIESQESTVQIIFTCDSEKTLALSNLAAPCIQLTHDKIFRDLYRFTWSRTKRLSRLRKLRKNFRKTIIRKVMQKADSFSYIDHTMRRLNAIGYEGLIHKELDHLSENTTAIYHTLFEECQKSRTPEDREVLRSLLAWLAYVKRKLTVADAKLLLEVIRKENAISIEEEVDGRLSRLLRISGERRQAEQEDSSDDDDKAEYMSDDNQDTEQNAEDANNFLSFQHRSLKAYFRQAIQDHPTGLRCTATEAHAIIFRISSAILTMPKTEQNTAAENLMRYASEWGLYHLHAISLEDKKSVSDVLAKVILESLYNIFTNKNESLKPMEQLSWEPSTVLIGNDITQDTALAMLSAWATRASQLPPSSLPYGVLDWFRPFIHEPHRIFIGLSRAHIGNWFSANNTYDAYSSFVKAHAALMEGRHLPQLKQNQVLNDYFERFMNGDRLYTEQSFDVVADCFWDIMKTSSSYKGIGMAMKEVPLYKQAVVQVDKGLQDGTIDDHEKYILLVSKGDTLMKISTSEENKDTRREYLEQSLAILDEANILYRKMYEAEPSNESIRRSASFSFGNTARVAAHLGKPDLVLSSVTEGRETKFELDPEILPDVISALKDTGHWSVIMDVLKHASQSERTWYLMTEDAEAAHEAAIRSKQGQYMLSLYEEAQKGLPPELRFATHFFEDRLQSTAAIFAHEALGDTETAKTLLREMINNHRTSGWRVLQGCNRLAGILFEDLRLSKDPHVKQNVLNETIKLLDKPSEAMLEGYDPAESHLITTVALMLQRLGPAIHLSEQMHAAFKNCIGELQDDTGMNDRAALRRLARLLGCIADFEQEASICLTAQCYVLDEAIRRQDLQKLDASNAPHVMEQDQAKRENLQAGTEAEHDGPAPMGSIDAVVSGNLLPDVASGGGGIHGILADTKIGNDDEGPLQSIEERNEMDEGLLSDPQPYCNYCTKEIGTWSDGAGYLCVYCIDVDICEECYSKKLAREKGELERDWRIICPQGHRHVKAPIQGWRGIKNGKLRIGPKEILFKTWLAQLETKWSQYWDAYWTEPQIK
ncbi:hypothetical protein ACEQ8H_006443 [Pleosporales sp. CAS-2024a]